MGILLRYFMKTKNGLSVLYFTCKAFLCVCVWQIRLFPHPVFIWFTGSWRHWGGADTELGCAGRTSMKGHVPCLGDCCGTVPPPVSAGNVGSLCLEEISKPVAVAAAVKLLQH